MSKRVVAFIKVVKGFLVALILVLGLGQINEVEAATSAQKENFKKEMLNMFYTLDSSKHNVSKYKITVKEFNELYDEIQYGEGTEIFGGYYPATHVTYTYTTLGGYVQTIQIKDANEDALTRYNAMLPQIEKILDGIEADMTDLDKVIYLHDSVVELVSYGGTTDAKYIASGAFLDQKAVCAGYAKALNSLLRRVGLDATYVKGTSLNHGWTYVELDGEWYHIDPTWDDTRSTVAGQTYRAHLLKNDAEFSKDHGVWTLKRINEASDSTLYRDWFVRGIVGKMSFEGGLWYYLDTARQVVMASDSLGKHQEIVFNYAELGKVKLIDAIDDQLILEVNGQKQSKSIDEWKQTVEDVKAEDDIAGGNITGEMLTDFSLDLSDISLWRTGQYNEYTGTYAQYKWRICTNDVIENVQDSYLITISDTNYRMFVRELNERKRIMTSVELGNGDVYVPGEGTEYLAITLYNCVEEKGNFFSVYEEMFANGFKVGLSPGSGADEETKAEDNIADDNTMTDADAGNSSAEEEVVDNNTTTDAKEEVNTIAGLDLSDISLWRTGQYNEYTGTYAQYKWRICTIDVIENVQDSYLITISNTNYRMFVRELNERKRIMTSVDLGNGDVYVPGEGTEYLAITLYNCVEEKGNFFSVYEEMFANGFQVGLGFEVQEETEEIPEQVEMEEVPEQSATEISGKEEVDNVQQENEVPRQTLRELLYEMLVSGDTSAHDVSAYNVKMPSVDAEWNAMIAAEGYIAFEARAGVIIQTTKDEQGKILTLWLYDLAGGDFQTRYARVLNSVAEVKAAVDDKMTELDKVLYVYEYVMQHTAYSQKGYQTAYAGGALGEGYAKCEGYARTCMLLLRQLGIECYRVTSGEMNHSWVYVKVDGEWFHLDATWDDSNGGSHIYLLRNSQEYDTMEGRHHSWELVNASNITDSNSVRLCNWFVHNVNGAMYYENGMWYYVDSTTGSVVRSDIVGNNYEVLVENTGNGYVLTGVADGQVNYYAK